MKLRNGAHVDRALDINPTATSAIAQHNASTPFMRIPLEIKNRIYEYVFGGNLIHVAQNPNKGGPKFMSYICDACISEEEAQEEFDSESNHPWYAPAIESRHERCHERHWEDTSFRIGDPSYKCRGAFSLSPLRSCRQIYNEAHHIPYSANTFGCSDPKTLKAFVVSLAQGSKGNNLAVRSLFLDIVHEFGDLVPVWKKAAATCAKYLTALQRVNISIDWRNFWLIISSCYFRGGASTEENSMRWRHHLITSILPLRNLPLKSATVVISDQGAEQKRERQNHGWRSQWHWMSEEEKYRWTLDEKKEQARYVRDVLLQS